MISFPPFIMSSGYGCLWSHLNIVIINTGHFTILIASKLVPLLPSCSTSLFSMQQPEQWNKVRSYHVPPAQSHSSHLTRRTRQRPYNHVQGLKGSRSLISLISSSIALHRSLCSKHPDCAAPPEWPACLAPGPWKLLFPLLKCSSPITHFRMGHFSFPWSFYFM